jgi:hypothetical protein
METEEHTAKKPMGDCSNKGRIFLESNENENLPESVGHSKNCAKGKVHSYKCLH